MTHNNSWRSKPLIPTEYASPIFDGDREGETLATGKDFEYLSCKNNFHIKYYHPSGVLALNPRPKDETFSIIYPKEYEPFNFHKLPKLVNYARNLCQYFKIKHIQRFANINANILDVGCGNGTLLKILSRAKNMNYNLYGSELNKRCADSLKNDGFQVFSVPLEKIEMSNTFDIIILNQVIEHFSDVNSSLQSCVRLLKPGGHLIIETPSTSGLDFNLFKHKYWGGYHFPRHFFLFNEDNLENLVNKNGLDKICLHYLASPAFWIQSFHHLFIDNNLLKLGSIFSIRNPLLLGLFTAIDTITATLGNRTSNMRMICVKR